MHKFWGFLLWAIISSFFIFNVPLFAQSKFKEAGGKIKFLISDKVDSVHVDGKMVDLGPGNIVSVSADSHLVQAYFGNYAPFSKTIHVKKYHIHAVPLKFTRPFSNIGIKSFWALIENPDLETASGLNWLLFGISTRAWGSYSAVIKEDFDETFQINAALIRIQKKLKKSVSVSPAGSFPTNISLNLAYQRHIYKRIYLRLFAVYYPKLTTQVAFYDTYPLAKDYGDPTYIEDFDNPFFLGGIDIVIASIKRSNINVYLSLGGFGSNSISKELELEIASPYIYTTNEPLVTSLKYSYSASGITSGIMTDIQFSKYASVNVMYRAFFLQVLKLDKKNTHSLLSDISANIVFRF